MAMSKFRAVFVYANGFVETLETVGGVYVHTAGAPGHDGGHWFRLAGTARNNNTIIDGRLLERATGAPNEGMPVYVEIAEPMIALAMVVGV